MTTRMDDRSSATLSPTLGPIAKLSTRCSSTQAVQMGSTLLPNEGEAAVRLHMCDAYVHTS